MGRKVSWYACPPIMVNWLRSPEAFLTRWWKCAAEGHLVSISTYNAKLAKKSGTISDKVVPVCDGGPFGKHFPL